VAGLEGGADDYVVKPFNARELLARVRKLLTRRGRADAGGAAGGRRGRGGPVPRLTVLIVVTKAWRETRDRWRASRRRELEPRILRWVHGDGTSVQGLWAGWRGASAPWWRACSWTTCSGCEAWSAIAWPTPGRAGIRGALPEGAAERPWWTRAISAERLGMAGALRAARDLAGMLEDRCPRCGSAAAAALGALGGEAAVRPSSSLSTSPAAGPPSASPTSSPAWASPCGGAGGTLPRMTVHGKLAAIDILGRVRSGRWWTGCGRGCGTIIATCVPVLSRPGGDRDADSAPAVVQMLRDPEWPVRAMAAKALGRLRFQGGFRAGAGRARSRVVGARERRGGSAKDGRPRPGGAGGAAGRCRHLRRHQAVLMLQEAGVVDQRIEALAGPDGPERRRAESLVEKLVAAGRWAACESSRPPIPIPPCGARWACCGSAHSSRRESGRELDRDRHPRRRLVQLLRARVLPPPEHLYLGLFLVSWWRSCASSAARSSPTTGRSCSPT
jgi:hypothetical protein